MQYNNISALFIQGFNNVHFDWLEIIEHSQKCGDMPEN
jgi:hypothetical protein